MSSWKLWIDEHKLICTLLALILLAVMLGGYFLYVRPALLRSKYKLRYTEEILASAEECNLDPYLVCGVIYTESGFRPEAKSKVGALGLMQLMPATGLEEAALLEIEGVEFAALAEERGTATKFSLRSVAPLDVAGDVAVPLGGGGHERAAGCTLNMGMEEALSTVLGIASKAIEKC